VYKKQAAKFPTILDCFILGVSASTWVGGGGQDGGFKKLNGKV